MYLIHPKKQSPQGVLIWVRVVGPTFFFPIRIWLWRPVPLPSQRTPFRSTPWRPGRLAADPAPPLALRPALALPGAAPWPVDREFGACDADENYMPMPSSSDSDWPEDEPLVEDTNMNEFRDELAHALFYGV